MARKISNPKLDTRTARAKLATRREPYWTKLSAGCFIGYRRAGQGGTWLARLRGQDGKQHYQAIGAADDALDADGAPVLNFAEAQERGREFFSAKSRALAGHEVGPPVTVGQAIDKYCSAREAREAAAGGAIKKDARSRLTKHVMGAPVAEKTLAELSAADLSDWRRALQMPGSSSARTANDFRAALNMAARRYRARLPERIRDVIKDGFVAETVAAPVAREAQILPDADVRALIKAAWAVDAEGEWGGDLARMIVVLAATGARFSQVQRLTIADVQFAERRLIVPASRKGRASKTKKPTSVRVGDDVLAALRPATAGRKGHEALLLRPRWRQVGPAKWERIGRAEWRSASELTRPWAEIVKSAKLAAGTVPYALRHSSIVRGLRTGLPVRLVAAIHDTSSAMIESHYAAFIVDALDDLAARAVVPLIGSGVAQ